VPHTEVHEPELDPPAGGVADVAPAAVPMTGDVARVLALQQSAGNAAVSQMLAREPTATATATGRWSAPFGMGGFGNTADASAALIDVGRELADVAKAGYPDAQPLADEAPKLATELAGSTDLTGEQATKLNEYSGRVRAVADPAIEELRNAYLKEIEELKGIDARAQEAEERLLEKLHHDFMDAASESVVSKTKEGLEKAKEYSKKAKDYLGYIEKAKEVFKAAEKVEKLKKGVEMIHDKVGEALEVVELAEAVLTITGQVGEAPGQFATDIGKYRAGMKLAGAAVDKAEIPLLGEYWKFIAKATEACLNGLAKIATLVDDAHRQSAEQEWQDLVQSGGGPPQIRTEKGSWENMAHTYPGGQPMLNLMWELMRDDSAVTTHMTPELEDYFVKFRSQFNAGEKDELETDTHWYDPTSWFGRTKSPNLKRWLVAHKDTVWAQLYGRMPHP
jgi:hypothetical protein